MDRIWYNFITRLERTFLGRVVIGLMIFTVIAGPWLGMLALLYSKGALK